MITSQRSRRARASGGSCCQAATFAPDVMSREPERAVAGLHEKGILTDEEFAAKKKQILGI